MAIRMPPPCRQMLLIVLESPCHSALSCKRRQCKLLSEQQQHHSESAHAAFP
jgi:hypothetical protein